MQQNFTNDGDYADDIQATDYQQDQYYDEEAPYGQEYGPEDDYYQEDPQQQFNTGF